MIGMAALLVTVLGAVGAWFLKHRKPPAPSVAKNTIAVLPLQNMTGDSNMEYLRFALTDEIASVLTYNRGLDVRPTASTRKYVGTDVDPQQAGHELRVANVVTGHYMKQGDNLLVTLQAVNVVNDSVTWQSSQITAPTQNFIALQDALTKQVRSGLLSALGAGNEFLETSTAPKNQEAYDLYLRSAAVPHDEKTNKEAITMLERSVGLDSTYAPAWQALGIRYYFDSQYSSGGRRSVSEIQFLLRACSGAGSEFDPGGQPTHHEPGGARGFDESVPGSAVPGETAAAKRAGTLHIGIRQSVRWLPGECNAGVR